MEAKKDCESIRCEERLQHCKILTYFEGYLDFIPGNLERILSGMEDKYGGNLPVAILAVIGPPSSGKSLLTNFLIEGLQSELGGGWIDRCKEFKQGFSWGSVKDDRFYQPERATTQGVAGGIYLWPEPFLMKKHVEKGSDDLQDVIVWVMHMCHFKEEEITVLERFLTAICSNMIEIQWKNKELRLMDHQLFWKTCAQPVKLSTCDRAVYLVRTDSKVEEAYDDEASKSILEMMSKKCDTSAYQIVLQKMENLYLAGIKDLDYEMENENGTLKTDCFRKIRGVMKKLVERMLSEDELSTKMFDGKDLLLSSMHDAISMAAYNAVDKRKKTEVTCKINQEPEVGPNTSAGNPHTEAASEITLHVNNSATVTVRRDAEPSDKPGCGYRERNALLRSHFFANQMKATSTPVFEKIRNVNETQLECRNGQQSSLIISPTDKPLSYDMLETEAMDTTEVATSFKTPKPFEGPHISDEDMEIDSNDVEEACKNIMDLSLENRDCDDKNEDVPQDSDTPGHQGECNFSVDKAEVTIETPPLPEKSAKPELHDIEIRCQEENGAEKLQRKKSKRIAEKNEKQKQEEKLRKLEEEEKKRRQQEEEAKRLKEEEEKRILTEKILMEHVGNSTSQFEETLKTRTSSFIDKHLNLNTMHNLRKIHTESFNSVVENHKYKVPLSSRKEFCFQVDANCSKIAREFLEPILSQVDEFIRVMKRKFELLGYFIESEKLIEILEEERDKVVMKTVSEATQRLIAKACLKIGKNYVEDNETIMKNEKLLHQNFNPQLINVYHEQMKRYMAEAPHHPNKLAEIHKKLGNKLVEALKNACRLQPNVDGQIGPNLASLHEQLFDAFKTHKNSNESKLRKLQMEVAKIADNFKSEYHKKCEEIFTKHPEGVDVRTLSKLHQVICGESKKLLEMEIRNKIRKDEPVESYTSSLQQHMDSYWNTVLQVNQKNFRQKEEREKQAELERLKEQAILQLQEKESKLRCEREASVRKERAAPISYPVKEQKDDCQVMPPLVLHFRSTNIVMGMAGFPEPLPNEAKESRTPAFVVVTPDSQIIYGSEALAFVQAEVPPEEVRGGYYWSIADLFSSPDKNLNFKLPSVAWENYTATHEFFLGFIFRKLKDAVEYQLTANCSRTLIVVPFWLSSTQRLRVKDAARLAGFSEIYLINESAAAAYNFVLDSDTRKSDNALVLVENLDRVDVFVYDYKCWDNKIRMMCHESNYENTKVKSGWLRRQWKKVTGIPVGISKWFQWATNYSADEGSSDQNEVKATIRDACRKATSRDCGWSDVKEFLCISGNNRKWGNLLANVARGFGRKAVGINEATAVMRGAIVLSRKTDQLGYLTCDKVTASVDRTKECGGAIVISCNENLPDKLKLFPTTLHSTHGNLDVKFYQEICGGLHSIGCLKITNVCYNESLDVWIMLNNEGIVDFSDLMTGRDSCKFKDRVSPERYKWEPENLSEYEFAQQSTFLALVQKPKMDPELLKGKEELLQKCTELEEKLTSGMLKVKSNLAKELVMNKIQDARRFADHDKVTLDQVNAHLDIVKKLFDKYDK